MLVDSRQATQVRPFQRPAQIWQSTANELLWATSLQTSLKKEVLVHSQLRQLQDRGHSLKWQSFYYGTHGSRACTQKYIKLPWPDSRKIVENKSRISSFLRWPGVYSNIQHVMVQKKGNFQFLYLCARVYDDIKLLVQFFCTTVRKDMKLPWERICVIASGNKNLQTCSRRHVQRLIVFGDTILHYRDERCIQTYVCNSFRVTFLQQHEQSFKIIYIQRVCKNFGIELLASWYVRAWVYKASFKCARAYGLE